MTRRMKKDYEEIKQRRARNYLKLNAIQAENSRILGNESIVTANLLEDSVAKQITLDSTEQADEVAPISQSSPIGSGPELVSRRSSRTPSISSMKKQKTFKRRKFGGGKAKKKKDPFEELVYAVPGMTRN